MKIVKEKTVAFTGNRTLTTSDGRPDANLENVLRRELYLSLEDCYKEGKVNYITGMAVGWDLLCGEVVLELKEKYPDIRLIAAIPFMGQELLYSNQDKQRFKYIYERADHIELITNGGYDRGAYHKRNDWMIANSSKIIAYDSGKRVRSGTSSTIRKAIKQNIEVVNLFQRIWNCI